MIGAALAALGALAIAARAVYPRYFEWRATRRRPLGPDGIIRGAGEIVMPREAAPGALLLHGGGDTPQILADLAAHLHAKGFSVRVPLLSGHGRRLSDLSRASARQWHADVAEAWSEMCRTHAAVAVVGLSMGGALAIKLAAERRNVPALVLLAPYVGMPESVRRLATTSEIWKWLLPYVPSFGSRSIRDESAARRTLGHGVWTPAGLRALYDVARAAHDALPEVRSPTLVVQSREDNRISKAIAEQAFERLGSAEKRFVWIEGAGHVITVDFGREHVFELTADWLETHLDAASKRPTG